MDELVLLSLAQAWRTVVIATAVFLCALAIAPYWDTAVFLKPLLVALSTPS
jgi:hypothetical protein